MPKSPLGKPDIGVVFPVDDWPGSGAFDETGVVNEGGKFRDAPAPALAPTIDCCLLIAEGSPELRPCIIWFRPGTPLAN